MDNSPPRPADLPRVPIHLPASLCHLPSSSSAINPLGLGTATAPAPVQMPPQEDGLASQIQKVLLERNGKQKMKKTETRHALPWWRKNSFALFFVDLEAETFRRRDVKAASDVNAPGNKTLPELAEEGLMQYVSGMKVKVNWDRVAWAALLVVVLVLLHTVISMLSVAPTAPPAPPNVFRVSEEVPRSGVEGSAEMRRTRRAVRAFLADMPESCGAAAANVGIYQRYILLRNAERPHEGNEQHPGSENSPRFTELVNPVLLALEGRKRKFTEVSDMCPPGAEHEVVRERFEFVRLRHDTPVGPAHLRLGAPEATCLQHFLDVLDGAWPCADDPDRLHRVPHYDKRYTLEQN